MAEKNHSYERGLGVDYTSSIHLEISKHEHLKRAEIIERLSRHAIERANPHVPIIGAVVGSGERTYRRGVVLGLDPSRKWGTSSIEENEELADYLSSAEGWQRRGEVVPALRVPLGRRRGYDNSNDVFSMREVNALFKKQGRTALHMVAADLFSIRFNPKNGGVNKYDEPGVLLGADRQQLASGVVEDILAVAEEMQQDRIVPAITGKHTQVYQQPQGAN